MATSINEAGAGMLAWDAGGHLQTLMLINIRYDQ